MTGQRAAFITGPLVALEGGDGEAVACWDGRIATLGASRATVWLDDRILTVELPDVRVGGARWSADGRSILAGPGSVDVEARTWTTDPIVAGLAMPGPPGGGGLVIRATSWAADRRHVAVLLGWAGPAFPDEPATQPRIVVVDIEGPSAPIELPADGASGVAIVGDRVVVAAPTVRAWTFSGELVAALPPTPGEPLRVFGDDAGPVFLLDPDWSIRVVEPATWAVVATWRGSFLDALAVPGGLIAIDLAGTLHAGRLGRDGIEELGRAETGIRAARLAATVDGRLVIMGAGPVPVHTLTYRLEPGG